MAVILKAYPSNSLRTLWSCSHVNFTDSHYLESNIGPGNGLCRQLSKHYPRQCWLRSMCYLASLSHNGLKLGNKWSVGYFHLNCLHALQWRYNGHAGVSNHQPYHCLINRLFRHRSKKTSKLRVNGICAGNSPHKWPVTRKVLLFDDVIMGRLWHRTECFNISIGSSTNVISWCTINGN